MKELPFEIMGAIVTVVGLLATGEPTSALPNIPFSLRFFDKSQPPINAKKYHSANTPLDGYPYQIEPAENQEP